MSKESEREEAQLWETVSSARDETQVEALLELSYIAFSRKNYSESLALCETARDNCEKLELPNENPTMAHIYFGIGFTLKHLGRQSEAAEALNKSGSLYQEISAEDAAHAFNAEGDAWYEAKDYRKSYESYRHVMEIASPETCEKLLAQNYFDAGTALERLKEWEQALFYFLEALKFYKKWKHPFSIAHCHEEISLCYFKLNDGVNALYFAQGALDIGTTAKSEFHKMWAKARMALANKALGEFERALELFTEVKAAMVRLENPTWMQILKVEREVSLLLEMLGRVDEATELRRRIAPLEEILNLS